MVRRLLYIASLTGLFFSLRGGAQVVNFGVAYLSPNTQYSVVSTFDNKNGAEFYNDGNAYFYNDLNNDGVFDYLGNTGYSAFVGNRVQVLTGSKIIYFYNLSFNNNSQPESFELYGVVQAEGRVNFLRGIVNNRDFNGRFIFGHQATSINASNYSHVNGSVQKYGDTAFIYPVGHKGYYRFAGIHPVGLTGLYTATYFYGNSALHYPHHQKESTIEQINDKEYWILKKATHNGTLQLASLSWDLQTTPIEFIKAAEKETLIVVGWDAAQQQWVNMHGNIDKSNKTITAAIGEYEVLTLGRIAKAEQACEIEVFNLVKVAGAGQNNYMRIQSSCAEIIKVSVYNRWGVKVFESTVYGPQGAVFDGYSGGRLTIARQNSLPTGTYYYIINYQTGSGAHKTQHQKLGYVYLEGS